MNEDNMLCNDCLYNDRYNKICRMAVSKPIPVSQCSDYSQIPTMTKEELDEYISKYGWKDGNTVWINSPESFRKTVLDNLTIAGKPLPEEDKDEIIDDMRKKDERVQGL